MPDSQTAVPVLLGARSAASRNAGAPRSLPGPALRLLPDERLARLASCGDRAAFGVIFNRYHQELHRYCVSILRNAEDAGDALQSTMLRALNALEGDDREIALRPWLYRIAHNESITLLRRRARAAEVALPDRSDGDAGASVRAEIRELLADLRHLPERQRGALVMRELGGLDYAEIAAAFKTSPAAAKQATYDARCTLHELAKGRELDCAVVSAAISDGDGRALRSRALRAHLRACGDCRSFSDGISGRQAKLASLAPAMPSAAAAGLLESVVGAAGGGGAAGAGAGLVTGVGVPFVAKSLATAAVVAALGAGALRVTAPGQGDAGVRPQRSAPPAAGGVPARSAHRSGAVHGQPAGRARPAAGPGAARKQRGASGGHPAASSTQPPHVGATHVSTPATQQTPAVATPAPSTASETDRHGPFRHLGSGSDDGRGGGHPIRRSVDLVIGHPNVAATVDHVRDALPVKVPPPPLVHPKRKRFG